VTKGQLLRRAAEAGGQVAAMATHIRRAALLLKGGGMHPVAAGAGIAD